MRFFFAENCLEDRWVTADAGDHGEHRGVGSPSASRTHPRGMPDADHGEKIAEVFQALIQERFHEARRAAVVAFFVSQIHEKIAEVFQAVVQERTHGHVVQQSVAFFVSQIHEKIAEVFQAVVQERFHGHVVQQSVAFFVSQIHEKIAEVFEAVVQERTHGHIADPSFPKCHRRKRQEGKHGSDPEVDLLEAALTRAREMEDEFLQAVPQDEAMKERQAEVHFRRNPEMLEFLIRKEGLW